MSASISESVIGCLTTLFIRRMDDLAHVKKKKKNLTCLQHPTVTEGGEAIEAPIVPGSDMLALMLTAFLICLLQYTGPQISVIGC